MSLALLGLFLLFLGLSPTLSSDVGIWTLTFDSRDLSCQNTPDWIAFYSTLECYSMDGKMGFMNRIENETNFQISIFNSPSCESTSLIKQVDDFLFDCFVDPILKRPQINFSLNQTSVYPIFQSFAALSPKKKTMFVYNSSTCDGDLLYATSFPADSKSCVPTEKCESGTKVFCGPLPPVVDLGLRNV